MSARFISHAEGVERSLTFLESPVVQDSLPVQTMAHVVTVVRELRAALVKVEGLDRDRAYYADQLMAVTSSLAPLCACDRGVEGVETPLQECPVHGDGVTFVAYVRALEAVAVAARAFDKDMPAGVKIEPKSPAVLGLREALRKLDGA